MVFDFVEPLCFAVHEAARTRWRELPVAWRWRPFEALPATREPGEPRPPERRALGAVAEAAFRELKLPFKPSKLLPNERLALRAHLWCADQGGPEVAGEFRDGVFRRLYERGLENHLHNPEVLAGLVERAGLDPMAFLADMRHGAMDAELVQARAKAWEAGVRAVPALVVGRSALTGEVPLAAWDAALGA